MSTGSSLHTATYSATPRDADYGRAQPYPASTCVCEDGPAIWGEHDDELRCWRCGREIAKEGEAG